MDQRLADLVRRENTLIERQRSIESQQEKIDKEHISLMERVRYVTATEEAMAHSKKNLEDMMQRVRNDSDECFTMRSELHRREAALEEKEGKLKKSMEDFRKDEIAFVENRKALSMQSQEAHLEPMLQRKLRFDEEEQLKRDQDLYLNLKAIEMKETKLKMKEQELHDVEKHSEEVLTSAQQQISEADKEIRSKESELVRLMNRFIQCQRSQQINTIVKI